MSLKVVRTILLSSLLWAGTSPVRAHVDWSTEGSIEASALPGCGNSPTCTRFVLSGCDQTIARANGFDVSIVRLPPMTGWHRAQLTWTASAGPVGDGLQIDFLGFLPGGCVPFGTESSEASSFRIVGTSGERMFQIPPGTYWLMLSATGGVGIHWSVVGVED